MSNAEPAGGKILVVLNGEEMQSWLTQSTLEARAAYRRVLAMCDLMSTGARPSLKAADAFVALDNALRNQARN